jgi:uncharacterized protein (TIGR02453 family)
VWPPDALAFLRELEDNNDGQWFRANRRRYDEHLVAPARELADRLRDLGPAHFFRPYNNLRFRPGPPIKEHLGVAIGYGAAGGFYFDLSLDGLLVAGGLYHPARDQLERFRAAMDDDRKARGFDRGLATARRAGLLPGEPELRRAPRGYPIDHPRIDHLRRKQLTVSCRHPLEPWLHEPICAERVRAELRAARPLVKWLAETVGASTQATRA